MKRLPVLPVVDVPGQIHRDGPERYLEPPRRTPPLRLAYRPLEVAKMLGIPKSTLYALLQRGEIRCVRLGKNWRGVILIPAEELNRLLGPPPKPPLTAEALRAALDQVRTRRGRAASASTQSALGTRE